MANFEIDPVKYGQLVEKVDKLESGMEELLALANKGRGGFWVGMMIVSSLSAIVGYVTHLIAGK